MFSKLIKGLLLASSIYASSSAFADDQCSEIIQMPHPQKVAMQMSYYMGLPHDLQYTLTAIGWKESQNGKWIVAVDEKSYGIYQIKLSSAMTRAGYDYSTASNFSKNKFASELLDQVTNAKYALMELEYWRGVRGNWSNMVKSYNAGWAMHNGEPYLYDISNKIKTLRACEKFWKSVE